MQFCRQGYKISWSPASASSLLRLLFDPEDSGDVTPKITIFRDGDQPYRLHFAGSLLNLFFNREDGSDMFLRNVELSSYTALQSRRPYFIS
jgi:hypothetical protein